MRRLPERRFEHLAVVLFDARYRVQRAALIPFEVVESRASYRAHTNAWRFMLPDAVWEIPGVVDVTEKLKAAELLV